MAVLSNFWRAFCLRLAEPMLEKWLRAGAIYIFKRQLAKHCVVLRLKIINNLSLRYCRTYWKKVIMNRAIRNYLYCLMIRKTISGLFKIKQNVKDPYAKHRVPIKSVQKCVNRKTTKIKIYNTYLLKICFFLSKAFCFAILIR